MNTTHSLEIIFDEEKPVEEQKVLKATVDCTWDYERNPGDKEVPHYHGEDDGYVLNDWSLEEVEIDGKLYPHCPPEIYSIIENAVEHLDPESP